MSKKKSTATYPRDVRFSHLRSFYVNGSIDSRGGLTVAYVQDTDQDGGPLVRAAIAFCHSNDNYSKHLGRVKAFGHLKQMTARGFDPSEETIVGERFFTLPGESVTVIPKLLNDLETEHGFYRVRKERTEQTPKAKVVL